MPTTQPRAPAIAAPYDPSRDLGPLFSDIQLSGTFADSKTFVDAAPRRSPSASSRIRLCACTAGVRPARVRRTQLCTPADIGAGVRIDSTLDMVAHIRALWPVLTRSPDSSNAVSTLIPLPRAYVVPGGRFREVYYWDSYFTMLGLLASGRSDLVKSMLDNFAYLIGTVGHVPTATVRTT